MADVGTVPRDRLAGELMDAIDLHNELTKGLYELGFGATKASSK